MGQHDDECRGVLSERQILDLFYESLHGDEWLDSSYHWEMESPVCRRKGVECNNQGLVTKIVLPSLGLRGPLVPEIGFLSKLQVLDLPNNHLKGFLPSDLRFAPLKSLDVRGSKLQGVVPPLLCIKEGVNGNGIGPPGTDINLLYACENIVCPRGTYSSIGRAALPGKEGDDGIQCLPCYDDHATLYMGRDHCTDIFILGMQLRRVDVQNALVKSIPIILAFIAVGVCMIKRRRKYSRNATAMNDVVDLVLEEEEDNNNGLHSLVPNENDDDNDEVHSSLPLQRWSSPPADEDEYSDDDWTAAHSDTDDRRSMNKKIELTMGRSKRSSRSRIPDVI
jgi:hypothetical protein